MSDNPILGFSMMNCLAARVTLLDDANTVQKNATFRTFRTAGTTRRQALEFWVLGATNFSSLRSFRKTVFSYSLTVRFR